MRHHESMHRRRLLAALATVPFAPLAGRAGASLATAPLGGFAAAQAGTLPVDYPRQPDDRVNEVVGASHGNFERVRELVETWPTLAKASWDWGFGDWETALGAAAHTGNREIALLLIEHGARPTLFSAAMLGQVDVVRAHCEASPGIQATPGPHGIPLMSHARSGREHAAAVVEYLEQIGGADGRSDVLPLDEATRTSLHGDFTADDTGRARVTFLDSRRDMLQMQINGGTARNLHHLGDLEFFVAGARHVRVTFEPAATGAPDTVVLRDGPLLLSARRQS